MEIASVSGCVSDAWAKPKPYRGKKYNFREYPYDVNGGQTLVQHWEDKNGNAYCRHVKNPNYVPPPPCPCNVCGERFLEEDAVQCGVTSDDYGEWEIWVCRGCFGEMGKKWK